MSDLSRRSLLKATAAIVTVGCGGEEDADLDRIRGSGPDDQARGDTGGDAGALPPEPVRPPSSPPEPVFVDGEDLDALPLMSAAFPYAVMAGDATSTKAVLWTRFLGKGTLHVQIEEEGGPEGKAVVSRPVTAAELGEAGFVHVDAEGLRSGVRHRYAFFVVSGGKPVGRSPVGFVRAAIAEDALEVVTFGGTSCTHQDGAPYPVLESAAKKRLDFFLHGGDHVYCDAGTDAVTLSEYRAKYGLGWDARGMKQLHSSTGMITAWDDHEFLNNFDPETIGATRLRTALRAYFEHRAQRRDPAAPNRGWRGFVWGKTLELLVLDTRTERKPSTRTTSKAQFLSPAQMAWLQDRLAKSEAVFKFVLTSVPMSKFPAAAAAQSDKWEGYAAQRNEILDFIQTKALKGVWWLSGDLHFGSVGGLEATGPRRAMREILMGPGGRPAGSPTLPATQFDRVVSATNYTVLRADPVKRELTVEFFGASGSLFKRTYAA
jgi:phosphodiesterase/alkaline phosphatase D-like protein